MSALHVQPASAIKYNVRATPNRGDAMSALHVQPACAGRNFFFITMLRQHSQYDSRLGFSFRVSVKVRVRVRVCVRVWVRVRFRVDFRVRVRVGVRIRVNLTIT